VKRFYQRHVTAVCCSVALVLCVSGTGMSFGHYTPGALGINAASLPPKGFHYTMYNMFYSADKIMDDGGGAIPGLGFDVNVYAMANQFTYMTDFKIFGGDYGFSFIIPLVRTDVSYEYFASDYNSESARLYKWNDDSFELGDICVEPFLLSWQTPHLDVTFGLGFYAPTADHEKPVSPGLGYWSFMETLGATYFFDDARTASFSVLTRWIQNSEYVDRNLISNANSLFYNETAITYGAYVVAEYGLAKSFPIEKTAIFTAGVAGYTYDQITDDSEKGGADNRFFGNAIFGYGRTGLNVGGATDVRFFGNAIGPEIRCMMFQPFPIQISARYLIEYGVENETEGTNACLTLIGSF